MLIKRITIYLFLAAALPSMDAEAKLHEIGQSYVYFEIYRDSVNVRLEIQAAHLNEALGLDMPWGERVPVEALRSDIDQHRDAIVAYLDEVFYIGGHVDGEYEIRPAYYRILRVEQGDFVQFTFRVPEALPVPDAFEVGYTAMFEQDSQHRNFVLVGHNWKSSTFENEGNAAFVLSPSNPRKTLDLSKSTVWTGFVGMVWFGVEHILIGFDHILFLLALILPSVLFWRERAWHPEERFRTAFINIVKIVTCFTIAHSITLSLAALEVVALPSILVESVIAASIAVAALHNLNPRFFRLEWLIAFVFGLFHGFGFAGLLQPLGLGREYTVLTLLGFNLGVEIGQIIVIGVIFPVLFLIRRRSWYTPAVLRFGSACLIAIALFWFVERAFAPPVLVEAKGVVKDIIRPIYHTARGLFT